ncbi:MAG: HAD family hydrolase [Anaerolineaceae bacterium]|nr:HAD family hydrolase [Anaerolineaceae bacterium]
MTFPKLIATDLDGTILHRGTEISERVIKALKAAKKRGAVLTIATGRSYPSIPQNLLGGEIFDYAIVANGALTKSAPFGKTILKELMDAQKLVEPIHHLERLGYMFTMQIEGNEFYEIRRAALVKKRIEDNHESLEGFNAYMKTTQPVQSVLEIIKTNPGPIVKLSAINLSSENGKDLAASLMQRYKVEVSAVSPREVEITAYNASKGKGLLALGKLLGISKVETIAFGDSGNDFSLVEGAGKVYAMANGEAQIKEIAHKIAPSIEEDGVALILEEILSQY